MSLHHEMQAAADEYARRLDATAEGQRLAALAAEARNATTTDQAATALGAIFADLDETNDFIGDPADDNTDTDTHNTED